MKKYIDIFAIFFKIGLFTFGGGYAMMPLFQNELVKKRNYITDDELIDLYSIGQCTPGVIAVNISTFIGYKQLGVLGAIFSTLGMVTPSLIIISVIASFLKIFASNEMISHAFAGIRVCVVALMLNILYGLFKKTIKNKIAFSTFIMSLALLFGIGVSPIIIVLLAGMSGFVVKLVKNLRSKCK